MDNTAMRVKVLEDVRRLLRRKVMIPRVGWSYAEPKDGCSLIPSREYAGTRTLAEVFIDHTCNVCVKGALFVSYVTNARIGALDFMQDNYRACSQYDCVGSTELDELLGGVFDNEELVFVESWFERNFGVLARWGGATKDVPLSEQYAVAQVRLEFIVEHMLRNNGHFVKALFEDEVRHAEGNRLAYE